MRQTKAKTNKASKWWPKVLNSDAKGFRIKVHHNVR